MSEEKQIEQTEDKAPVIQSEDHILNQETRDKIKSSSVHENFQAAVEARDGLRKIMAQVRDEKGGVDFGKVEGMSDAEAYNEAQKHQAVIAYINHVNTQKLSANDADRAAAAPIVGAPAMQMFDNLQQGRSTDVFERFKDLHGLDVDKIFQNHKFQAPRATVDDFLMVTPGGSNTGTYTGATGTRPDGSQAAGVTNTGAGATNPGSGLTPLTWTGGSTGVAPGHSHTGVPVDRYLSQIPAQMHLRKRDYLTPLIPRIPCPPMTDTLRYIAEELASGAPGSSNRVAARGEGERAPLQDMSTREISITVVKRMVAATITNEQITDTLQARQIMNDNLLIKIQEDFEDQIINGNDMNGNMKGIMYKPTNAPNGDLREVDAAHPFYKQLIVRGAHDDQTLLDFYLGSITRYLKPRPDNSIGGSISSATPSDDFGAGRSPTHIVLPLAEKMRLMGEKDNQGRYLWANTVEGDFISLWGMPIITSDYIKPEEGLIVALDELAVIVKAGVEWNFGLKDDDVIRDQTTMVAKHRANVLCKRPRAIMILRNLAGDSA